MPLFFLVGPSPLPLLPLKLRQATCLSFSALLPCARSRTRDLPPSSYLRSGKPFFFFFSLPARRFFDLSATFAFVRRGPLFWEGFLPVYASGCSFLFATGYRLALVPFPFFSLEIVTTSSSSSSYFSSEFPNCTKDPSSFLFPLPVRCRLFFLPPRGSSSSSPSVG